MPKRCALRIEGRGLLGETLVERAVVLVRGGRVLWSGPATEAPLHVADETVVHEGIVAPGYIDLHVHGGGGADAADAAEIASANSTRSSVAVAGPLVWLLRLAMAILSRSTGGERRRPSLGRG